MLHNSDFRYDLKRGQQAERWFAGLLTGDTIECKRDFKAHKTGRVFVEFECRGKPSGISTSEAEYWVYIYGPDETDLRAILLSTFLLREKVRSLIADKKVITGGDQNLSKGVLIELGDLAVCQ